MMPKIIVFFCLRVGIGGALIFAIASVLLVAIAIAGLAFGAEAVGHLCSPST
jgi:hypothetical protein